MRKPFHPHHRRYEALRAYFLDRQPAAEVVRRFRYSVHSLKVMVSQFRRDLLPLFFRDIPHGRKDRSVAEPLRDEVVRLRKEENLSFRDIAERIKAQGRPIAFHTIWLLLREAGFGHLSRMTSKKWEGPPPPPPRSPMFGSRTSLPGVKWSAEPLWSSSSRPTSERWSSIL